LSTRLDKSLLVLEGGCNLRFFYRSVRYSEDLDLDTRKIAVGTLGNQVDRLLASSAFRQSLRAQSLEIQSTSAPKQTETTQRWKIRLSLSSTGQQVPTKIEFSRRPLRRSSVRWRTAR
jgi:predicted nucleotidyltransferase component of viral defense system